MTVCRPIDGTVIRLIWYRRITKRRYRWRWCRHQAAGVTSKGCNVAVSLVGHLW